MTHSSTSADEARALALLQQLASLCDETRRTASANPDAVNAMLATFEETLAILAPVLERIGNSPAASRDTVLEAARYAADRHQALIASMSLEVDRLSRSIAEMDHAMRASAGYAEATPSAPRGGFEARG